TATTCCATASRRASPNSPSCLCGLPTDGESDVRHRVVLVLVHLVLNALPLRLDLRLCRGAGRAWRAVRAQADLRGPLEHHAEVEVEVDPFGPDVAVADAEVRCKAVLRLDLPGEAAARREGQVA